jgi:hypothetical protein
VVVPEEWRLGSACASVNRTTDGIEITLRGIVTAPAYEELHSRIARENHTVVLLVDDTAILALTCLSAAEAATRATAKKRRPIIIAASPLRIAWALEHCRLLLEMGLALVAVMPVVQLGS